MKGCSWPDSKTLHNRERSDATLERRSCRPELYSDALGILKNTLKAFSLSSQHCKDPTCKDAIRNPVADFDRFPHHPFKKLFSHKTAFSDPSQQSFRWWRGPHLDTMETLLGNYSGGMVPFCRVDTVLRHEDHSRRTMILIFVNTLVSILLPNNELKNSALKDLYF